jgi:hypothetical protein
MADVLADPDFAHMSDSDGDDLPLFENALSEDEEGEDGDKNEDREAEAEEDKRRNKVEDKANEYMESMMNSVRGGAAAAGEVKKKEPEVSWDWKFILLVQQVLNPPIPP